MNGPSLTPNEAVATVAQRVRRLEAYGIERDRAIGRAAAEYAIDPEKVRWCLLRLVATAHDATALAA
jgi:hypothetical protein